MGGRYHHNGDLGGIVAIEWNLLKVPKKHRAAIFKPSNGLKCLPKQKVIPLTCFHIVSVLQDIDDFLDYGRIHFWTHCNGSRSQPLEM